MSQASDDNGHKSRVYSQDHHKLCACAEFLTASVAERVGDVLQAVVVDRVVGARVVDDGLETGELRVRVPATQQTPMMFINVRTEATNSTARKHESVTVHM